MVGAAQSAWCIVLVFEAETCVVRLAPFRFGETLAGETVKSLRRVSAPRRYKWRASIAFATCRATSSMAIGRGSTLNPYAEERPA